MDGSRGLARPQASAGLERISIAVTVRTHWRCLEHLHEQVEGMQRLGAEHDGPDEGVPGEEVGWLVGVGEEEQSMGKAVWKVELEWEFNGKDLDEFAQEEGVGVQA